MNFPKRWDELARFAAWCRLNNIGGYDAAELHLLAHRAFLAGTRVANTGRSADRARVRFEARAKELGFTTTWPGLYPMLHRRGRAIYLAGV